MTTTCVRVASRTGDRHTGKQGSTWMGERGGSWTRFLHAESDRPGNGTGDWKVASTGRLESLPYVGAGTLPEPAF